MPLNSFRILLFGCCLLAPASHVLAEKTPQSSVADLRYGTSLYEYFQGNYFNALSELLVAKERGGIKGHGNNPDMIEGGISLAFGLDKSAEASFDQYLSQEEHTNNTTSDAAWFYLAKLNYRQQHFQKSLSLLGRINSNDTQFPHQSELIFNSALQSDAINDAKALLSNPFSANIDKLLAHYNLASYYARQQQYQEALRSFENLAAIPIVPDEDIELQRTIMDMGHTAAGHIFQNQALYPKALEQFRQVRLNSHTSLPALLGYGWAAINDEEYQDALRPLQELMNRDPLEPSVQEALLALPYSYEKLKRPAAALDTYQRSEIIFSNALAEMDEMLARLQATDLSESMQQQLNNEANHNSVKLGWLNLAAPPASVPRYNLYLQKVIASEQFQQQLIDLRDLVQLNLILQDWQARTAEFSQVMQERENKRQTIESRIDTDAIHSTLATYQSQLENAQASLTQIETAQNYTALALNETREQLETLAELDKNTAYLLANGESIDPHQQAQIERYRGILLWQSSESFNQNLWRKKKALHDIERELAQLQSQQKRTTSVISTAPELIPLKNRLAELQPQLDNRQQAVTRAMNDNAASLQLALTQTLSQHRSRVQQYLAHTQLAIARLYDQALQEQQP